MEDRLREGYETGGWKNSQEITEADQARNKNSLN